MRYFLEVRYDGTAFHGSQLQGAIPTVQLALNKGISTLLRKNIETFGASRTDEGVHAICNFYHIEVEDKLPEQFLYKINAILPSAISVSKIYIADNINANARFDALSRRYRYRIYQKKNPFLLLRAYHYPFAINKNILSQTADVLMSYTDFESFSKRNTQTRTYACQIFNSYWEEKEGELHFVVEGNRFLRGMVRALVGTQLLVAREKTDVLGFKKIIESKDCTKADFSVPGYGLYLEKITYPEGMLLPVE